MILVIKNNSVFATHADHQSDAITFRLYPEAENIKQVTGSHAVGEPDPTIADPGCLVSEILNTDALPTIYATLALSGGDGKTPLGLKLGHATKGTMTISGELRADPDIAGSLTALGILVSYSWRITLRKVTSEFFPEIVDSVPLDGVTVADNIISWEDFDPETLGLSPGIYCITDRDFATLAGTAFGLATDYRVTLIGGDKYFKVLK